MVRCCNIVHFYIMPFEIRKCQLDSKCKNKIQQKILNKIVRVSQFAPLNYKYNLLLSIIKVCEKAALKLKCRFI